MGSAGAVTHQHVTVPSDNKRRMCGSAQKLQQEDSAAVSPLLDGRTQRRESAKKTIKRHTYKKCWAGCCEKVISFSLQKVTRVSNYKESNYYYYFANVSNDLDPCLSNYYTNYLTHYSSTQEGSTSTRCESGAETE